MVTVVSPPEMMQAGEGSGVAVFRTSFAMATWTRATSFVSPSIMEDNIKGLYPRFFAFFPLP